MNLSESYKKRIQELAGVGSKYNYVGNCVTGLEDEYFQRKVCYDATEMAQIVENSKYVPEEEFMALVNWPDFLEKPNADSVQPRYELAYNADNDIMWAWDMDEDIHYFFVR